MTRKKEINNPIRIDLMIDQNIVHDIDRISRDTGLSRSKLIRIACKAFLKMIENQIIDDDTKKGFIFILDSFLTGKIPDFTFDEIQIARRDNVDLTEDYYNHDERDALLSCTWKNLQIAIIAASIDDLEDSGIIDYIDKKEIIPKEKLSSIIKDLELDENDSKKLTKILINMKKSKKGKN